MNKKFNKTQLHAAWLVLDEIQNSIPTNQTLSFKEVMNHFEIIQDIKDKIDVRKPEQKIPAESVLPHLQSEVENEMPYLQPFKNNLRALLCK